MADSPPSSDLSSPPSQDDFDDQLSTAVPSSRPSVDITHNDIEHLAPPSKKRKTGPSSLSTHDRAPSSQPDVEDDTESIAVSEDSYTDAPGSPSHGEYAMRADAQITCEWRDCDFGDARNNDELVRHVQATHCATGGPKRTKYVCEWGECQRKTSNHPSGYALKAHMRSHTKEKPYYCALPECDKAFTRSDALAKHMRTVHEPEQARGTAAAASTNNDPSPNSKGKNKVKLTNGANGNNKLPAGDLSTAPTHDEDGNPVDPSPASDNITYIPAHHPITGQPGFMIHYPPDIHFTAWESSIDANQLVRLLRRQVYWAEQEGRALSKELMDLEKVRKEEWMLKELLLEGVMESELARGDRDGLLEDVNYRVQEAMHKDAEPARQLSWTGEQAVPPKSSRHIDTPSMLRQDPHIRGTARDMEMQDAPTLQRPPTLPSQPAARTPSPPPTGDSMGFDGADDPYDNYMKDRMAAYQAAEKRRSVQSTPQKSRPQTGISEAEQAEQDEADAAGALMGLSGGKERTA